MSNKGNMPRIEIKYLLDIELSVGLTNLSHELSRQSEITQDNITVGSSLVEKNGKKGFFLSGGNVDENGVESGSLMDGTYTFFDNEIKYPGALGTSFSQSDGTFATEQSITISVAQNGTYLKHLVLYFDAVAGEYATSIKFSDEPNKIYKNSRYIFLRNFGQNSTLTSVTVTFIKWSKVNSLAKILKIKTGITGIYDYNTIQSMRFSNEKYSNEKEVSFGITSQFCDLSLIDKTGDILAIHEADLFLDNVIAEIYLVNENNVIGEDDGDYIQKDVEKIGEFILDEKQNQSGNLIWNYGLIDKLEQTKTLTVTALEVGSRSIYTILNYILQFSGFNVEWSNDAKTYCQDLIISQSYLEPGQFVYDAIGKCCEIGLLKVFIAPNGNVRIERGL